MAKNKSKMIVAISLGAITLFLVVGLWVFYFTSVDAKVVARANKVSIVAGAETNKAELGRDLSKELKLEYALDETQRENGLMRRTTLCENCGMFFVFNNTQPLTFWMKNTLIPLDIIFITKDGVVTNIEQASAEPNNKDDTQYQTYRSNGDALYVLEVNRGWSQKNQLKAGDNLNILNILPKN